MTQYCCSSCGKPAFHDGRCGDGPILMCRCDERGRQWIDDGRGGYWSNPTNAKPVEAPYYSEADEWDDWLNRR